ncbi:MULTISPECIES: STN domain-containing protein [Variovorax]|uniref:STN domain-containing protein n=1 Tax=Variovorax TaxID=34072 RepID=UPI000A8D699F|nr:MULTISPECIES: STN domain-containing protein [Variovorax]MBN8752873.1 STN domain-containing protein [Variovorax sp.]UKI08010.1 STN domain-containing protein [Variovorax paradoxus]
MRTGNTASLGALALVGCLACLGLAPSARAQPADAAETASPGRLRFDIRAQPLHEALQQYSAATGRSLLYDSSSVADLVSAPLNGFYTPQEALRQLIAGTGMEAQYTSRDAFMLVPMTPEQAQAASATATAPPAPSEADAQRQRYLARMQARITQALCGDAATAPGAVRLALRFRIDRANTIRQLEVHAQEGHAGMEAKLRLRLAGLDLGAAPPAQLGQPVTMLVLPGSGSVC